MSISIGAGTSGMGPRGVLHGFGQDIEEKRSFNRKVFLRLSSYLKPYWRQMVVAFTAMLAASALTLITPYLLKIAIDIYIKNGDLQGLGRISLYTAGAFIGLYLATSTQQYLLSWVGQRVLANLRMDMFRHLQELSIGYHDTHIVGVTVSRVINDVAVINQFLSEGVVTLTGDTLILAGIITIMVSMNPRLALLAFAVIPLMILATTLFARRAQSAYRETRSRVAAVVGDLAEDLAGMRVIQAFAQESTSQERFHDVNLANRDAHINAMSLSFIFLPTVEFLGMLAAAIVLWFGGRLVVQEAVTLGTLVAFLSYVSRFFQPIQELSQLFNTMQAAMAGGEQVIRLLDSQPDVKDIPNAPPMPPIIGKIQFSNVSFSYRKDTPLVLQDINLEILPAENIALVGQTGAGKTSIANLVARFYDVTGGAITIDEIDIRSVNQQSLRKQIGFIPQTPFLFSGSIAENIGYGKPDASFAEIERAARLANAHEFIQSQPDRYETVVLEGGVNLSVGQRQLICMARAILPDPRIIIMDEATANIDTLTENLIQEALKQVLKGRTSIIIAHRLSTVRSVNRIYVIQDGRIAESGTHIELLNKKGIYTTLYQRQFADQE